MWKVLKQAQLSLLLPPGIGNRLAASGQYEMAVKYFTDAIKCNPKEFK